MRKNEISDFRLGPLNNEDGATAAEYAILVSLIAGVVILAVTTLGISVNSLFGTFKL